jgi:hypothetical protein
MRPSGIFLLTIPVGERGFTEKRAEIAAGLIRSFVRCKSRLHISLAE